MPTMADSPDIKSVQPGDTVADRYVVRAIVGRGGMGCIYRVYDKVLEEEVALKTLLPDHVDDKVVLERFFNEARIARSLSHPNIIRVHDIGMDKGIIYISMELLKGRSLREMIDRLQPGQRLPINGILRMFDALCAALDYAHRYTIHRDIKPENVMILPDGSVKLMDFGISKLMSNPNLTSASVVMGTPHYMPPEQLKNTSAVDARADIYSMGVMLYEVLTGDRPTGLAKPASKIRGEVPAALDPIIEKCCQPDPNKRFQSAAELREALREIRIAVEQGTDPEARAKMLAAASPRPRAWVRAVATALLLLAIVAGMGVGLVWAEQRRHALLDTAAPTPSTDAPPIDTDAAQFARLKNLMPDLRKRAQAATQDFPAEDQDGLLAEILQRGDDEWAEAQRRAAQDPAAAIALAWDAAACYLAPIIWPDGAFFVPPAPPDASPRRAAFFIDARPVSLQDFAAFWDQGNGWRWPKELAGVPPSDQPTIHVTAYDALAYLASQSPPKRLPTSDEWVRAVEFARKQSRLIPPGIEPPASDQSATESDEEAAPSKDIPWLTVSGAGFSEWTVTRATGDDVVDPTTLTFGDDLLTCGGYWTAGGDFEPQPPVSVPYERSLGTVGFRGVLPLPLSLNDIHTAL